MHGVIWNLATVLLVMAPPVLGVANAQDAAAAPAIDSNAGTIDFSLAPELPVKAWRTFGTGRADASPQSVNPPDGLAFTPDGLLLATDAENRRVQIFDPMSGIHVGSLGDADLFPGEVVGLAVTPNGRVLVSDETVNRIRIFCRHDHGDRRFAAIGPPVLGDARFQRLTGVACDSAGRLYAVDSATGDVRRYLPGFVPDPRWNFQSQRPDGKPILNRPEGVVIHEETNTLFVASEWDGMILAYDAATGRWLGKAIGRRADPVTAEPIGASVFSRSVEGLAILGDYLLAVDEGSDDATTRRPGRLLVFRLGDPALFETDPERCRARRAAGKTAGLIGWFGDFRSPDGVAAFAGRGRCEPLAAVADQGRYRVVLYRGSDLIPAIHSASARAGR